MSSPSLNEPSPRPILEIARQLGLDESAVEPFGWHAGKLTLGLDKELADRPCGKYVGVTAVNPTPFGEGKTVVSIGLAMGLARRLLRSIVTLRQPSLAPVFGIKGGGAGGGRARVIPSDQINLHFTGDLHAVAAANNLLAAIVDNHCKRRLEPVLEADAISWRRAIDISDKGLFKIEIGLDDIPQCPKRITGFDLTAASEVMTLLALATDFQDLRNRLGRIVVGRHADGTSITADDVGAGGAMAALLRNALRPNLVQTAEHTPAIVHAGPFGNIAHGNCSVLADLTALRLADFVVTESGFGSELGAEKLFDIKCRTPGLRPDVEVLVCTVRALKFQSGRFDVRPGNPLPESLLKEDLAAIEAGISNLAGHLANLHNFGVPVVVAINRFPSDTDAELALLKKLAIDHGAHQVAVTTAFSDGGEGSLELADAVVKASKTKSSFRPLYSLDVPYSKKIESIATKVYGADGVDFASGVEAELLRFANDGFGDLPVCIAKTQYSLSHDPKKLGRPTGFRLPITEVRLNAGAGFVLAMTEGISLMPGLPKNPSARDIDVSPDGKIIGLDR